MYCAGYWIILAKSDFFGNLSAATTLNKEDVFYMDSDSFYGGESVPKVKFGVASISRYADTHNSATMPPRKLKMTYS